jgi:hypothetical protein
MIEFFESLFVGIAESLQLNPGVFAEVARTPDSRWVILSIAILGGASLLGGQCFILFLNRVSRKRFLLSLLLNGVLFASSMVIWSFSIWFAGQILFPNNIPFDTVARVVGLGASPYLLGILVMIPYLGRIINRLLTVWSFLIVLSGIAFLAGGDLFRAVVSVGAGWLLVSFMSAVIGKPVIALRQYLFRKIAKTDLDLSVEDVLTEVLGPDVVPLLAEEENQV